MSELTATLTDMAETSRWNRGGVQPSAQPTRAPAEQPLPETSSAAAMVGKRTVAEVAALVENIHFALSQGYDMPEWHEGVSAAYQWATGQSPAPYTGRTGIPDRAQLQAEDDAADEALRMGPRRTFANGVQHAVMWILGLTEDQPWFYYG